jgi:hypothetical protein
MILGTYKYILLPLFHCLVLIVTEPAHESPTAVFPHSEPIMLEGPYNLKNKLHMIHPDRHELHFSKFTQTNSIPIHY